MDDQQKDARRVCYVCGKIREHDNHVENFALPGNFHEFKPERRALATREPEPSGWISAVERLPEKGERVLVWVVDDNSTIGGERREYLDAWNYSPGHPYFPSDKIGQGVTHWMKSPAAPSATREGEKEKL